MKAALAACSGCLRSLVYSPHSTRTYKGKGIFYSAVSSPLDHRSKRFTLFALPGRPVHSNTNSVSPGSILVMHQLRATTKSPTFPPLSKARYSFVQLSQQGRQWRERKCPIFETVAKRDSNPGSLDCESGFLPLSYRAPNSCADAAAATLRPTVSADWLNYVRGSYQVYPGGE